MKNLNVRIYSSILVAMLACQVLSGCGKREEDASVGEASPVSDLTGASNSSAIYNNINEDLIPLLTQRIDDLEAMVAALKNTAANPLAGPQGIPGIQGSTGIAGPQGEKGASGKNGVDGKNGENGVNGSNGENGKNGENGASFDPATLNQAIQTLLDSKSFLRGYSSYFSKTSPSPSMLTIINNNLLVYNQYSGTDYWVTFNNLGGDTGYNDYIGKIFKITCEFAANLDLISLVYVGSEAYSSETGNLKFHIDAGEDFDNRTIISPSSAGYTAEDDWAINDGDWPARYITLDIPTEERTAGVHEFYLHLFFSPPQ